MDLFDRALQADAFPQQLLAGTDAVYEPLLIFGSRWRWSASRLCRVESPCFAAKLCLRVSEVPSAGPGLPKLALCGAVLG